MIKKVDKEAFLDEVLVRDKAKLYCDQALEKAVAKLLAKHGAVDQNSPEFTGTLSSELHKICKYDSRVDECVISRFIAGGVFIEFFQDNIDPFSVILTTEQIAKEICWQQHPASRKGTYL